MSAGKSDCWILIRKDGRTHNLPHGMIFIGREECDIILQAASADKRHAVLCYNNSAQEFHIKDLNSLTGTYVNGIRIPEQTYVKLKHLDCIRFGYGPDVFYLENTPLFNKDEDISRKDFLEEGKSVHGSEESDLEIQSNASVPVSRTDHPPDSLPLPSMPNGEVEYDYTAHEDNYSDSPDYSQQSEGSSSSAPAPCTNALPADQDSSSTNSSPAAMAFTVAFENEVSTPRKKLGIRDSISKFAPTKAEGDGRITFQKSSKSEPSPKKFSGSSAPRTRSLCSQLDSREFHEQSSKIKEPASFLIKKMLNGDSIERDGDQKENIQGGELPDDKSEAGTYTVETEHTDCDVEEARKKIDEVFGVIQLSSSVVTSYSSSTTSSSIKQIPCLSSRLKQAPLKNSISPKQKGVVEPSPQWNKVNKNSARSKRRLPTPPSENVGSSECVQPLNQSMQRVKKPPEQPSTPERRRAKVASSPKSPGKSKPLSSLKSPGSAGSVTNNLSAVSTDRPTSCKEDSSRPRSSDSRSEGSKSPHSNAQWHKVPWNLSGSDLDLDHSKSENNSVLSDTSTEPSSHSSHSGRTKLEQGPQMRLNRAFALRRARLEAESVKRGKENKALPGGQKPLRKTKLSGSTSTLKEEGNRLNFRLAPAIAKPILGRPGVKSSGPMLDTLNRKTDVKTGHRRIESDPGKGIPVWKTDGKFTTSTETARKTLTVALSVDSGNQSLQSFHRSVSCSVMNEAEGPRSNLICNSISQRDFPLNLIKNLDHSAMSGSQIVTSQNIEEYQSRSHQNKEITALDCLVISAIHQLSTKLWVNTKVILDKERKKFPKDSDSWLMIDEVLPQAPLSETPEDGDLTKDLSSILKNLKRVEQGLEVLSSVLETDSCEKATTTTTNEKPHLPKNFFIVDM